MSLQMFRGDTFILDVTFTRNNLPINITGAVIYFTAKRLLDQDDSAAVFQKSTTNGIVLTNPTGGIAQIRVEADDTKDLTDEPSLFVDIQLKELDGTISTTRDGLKIVKDVTRTQ